MTVADTGLAQEPVAASADLPLRASEEIQGNILAGFSKDHQTFLFLAFNPQADPAKTRAYVAELTPRIATTKQVATFNAQFSNARRQSGGTDPAALKAVWVNLGLTFPGLNMLAKGIARDLSNFPAFLEGPLLRAPLLGDVGPSDPARWVIGARAAVAAILTVAADDEADLQVELEKQRTLIAKHSAAVSIIFEQRGDTLPDAGRGHEHFGFKDGVSQPGVKGFHAVNPDKPSERLEHPGTEMIAAGEFVLGHSSEQGTPSVPRWMKDGSFQVWRRLSQDVPGWWAQVTRNQQALPSDDPATADALAAKLVGRWRSGTPLAHAPDNDNRSGQDRERDNDFTFHNDPEGHTTPRFAHIRKMYPRDREQHGDNMRRIIRRGIPFGAPFNPTGGRGHGVDADRGLIFNVFMSSIEGQFEFLQQTWANNQFFPADDGPDPVIGDAPGPVKLRRANRPQADLDFRRFVHTTGAVYAFAPSLTTLRKLGAGEAIIEAPEGIQVGGVAFVVRTSGQPLRMRDRPSLRGTIVGRMQPNTQVTVLDGPRTADGHTWWHVTTSDGRIGWAAGSFLDTSPE